MMTEKHIRANVANKSLLLTSNHGRCLCVVQRSIQHALQLLPETNAQCAQKRPNSSLGMELY